MPADLILGPVVAIRDRLVEMEVSAWSLSAPVALGRSFTDAERGPLGVVAISSVPSQFDGTRSVEETYAFTLGLRRPLAAGTDIDAVRVADAQAFGVLFHGETWGDLGAYMPFLGQVDMPTADLADGYHDLYITVVLKSDRFQ